MYCIHCNFSRYQNQSTKIMNTTCVRQGKRLFTILEQCTSQIVHESNSTKATTLLVIQSKINFVEYVSHQTNSQIASGLIDESHKLYPICRICCQPLSFVNVYWPSTSICFTMTIDTRPSSWGFLVLPQINDPYVNG